MYEKFNTISACVSENMSLVKINNHEVRNFLLKYTQTDPPDESASRKSYLPKYYEETNKIQVLCSNENIWVSIGETINAYGSTFADAIGVLKNKQMLSEEYFFCHAGKCLK
jgi:hypothetical protein